MVATERIKLAEVDDELRVTIEEKEALKSALKLIERENDRLRHSIASSEASVDDREVQIQEPAAELKRVPQSDLEPPAASTTNISTSLMEGGPEDRSSLERSASTETVVLHQCPTDTEGEPAHSSAAATSGTAPRTDNPWSS